MNTSFLDIKNLCGGPHKKNIIKEISFTVPAGIVGIIGKNGAGKTTLIKTILDSSYRRSGEIIVRHSGKTADITKLSYREKARFFAYAPQEMTQAAHCPVKEFIVMGRAPYLKPLQNPCKTDMELAENSLKTLGIAFLGDRDMSQLSGGEKRLAYIARANVQEALWMLLDEPSTGLDFGRQYQFFEFLADYVKKSKTGALVSIHDPSIAYRYCDDFLILDSGQLIAQLSKKDTDFDKHYITALRSLYGKETDFAKTDNGKMIIWAGDKK